MLVNLSRRMNLRQTPLRHVIVMYGSSNEHLHEITNGLPKKIFELVTIGLQNDYARVIETRRPDIVIIGGRCSPEDRMQLRHIATKVNEQVHLSEPGIEYMNETDHIIRDVVENSQNELKNSSCPQLTRWLISP